MRASSLKCRLMLSAGAGLTVLTGLSGAASAGGFAPREQSTVFLGSAFAGSAAGGALSSMFWNPAALGQFSGINSESAYSLILPDSEITATAGSTFLAAGAKSGDIGDTALLPASYFSYQLNNDIVLGMGINAPFGLTTDGKFSWAGSTFARESKIETYNFSPTVAYKVAPGIIVGAGLQVEYIKAQLRNAFVALGTAGPSQVVKGDDVAFGFTAGILVTPAAGTRIGVGFRSSIDHELDGTFHIPFGAFAVPRGITAGVETPEMVTASLRQEIAPAWTLLGTVEWTNWSRLTDLTVVCDVAACLPGGASSSKLALGWHDGWFFSGGLEHAYSDQLTLRGGVAYEISPIQNPDERTIRVADANRFWVNMGGSYKYSEWTTLDFAYSHIFVQDARTDRTEAGGARLVGDVESSVDIISVGVRSKLDWLLSGG